VRWVGELAERWGALAPTMRDALLRPAATDADLRRWAARAGRTRIAPLLRLAAAVWAAERAAGLAAPSPERVRSTYRRALRTAYRDAIEVADLAVDGDDLLRAGVRPGPNVGKILHALLARVLDDPSLNIRDRLVALALEMQRVLDADGQLPPSDTAR